VRAVLEKLLELFPEQEDPKPNKFTVYMGNAIKEAREEQGLSQEELAKKIYRRRATLSDIENGKSDVDAGTLWLLSAYLKKPLSYF
jgi:transcriptional regulator with XRE-family HTH domain